MQETRRHLLFYENANHYPFFFFFFFLAYLLKESVLLFIPNAVQVISSPIGALLPTHCFDHLWPDTDKLSCAFSA